MKKIISAVTLISIITALGSGCASAENENSVNSGINVIYDGQTIDFDVQPEIIDGRVMVPMRTIFEIFGAKVKWDSDTQTITAKKKSKTISMTIGNTDMTKNDETYSFDAAPLIEEGRTLVPIRAISDMLGLDVEWDNDSRTVEINTATEDEDESWKENTGTINLSNLVVTGEGVNISDNIITITQGGDFEVVGTLADGQIVVDTESKVKLRLSGMNLTNPRGSAIYVKNADKAYITVTDATENTLTDGETYTSGDDNEKGCITSRDNLEIKGNGGLIINGNYNHGIYGGDSVDVGNGNITINAQNDGIHVNETLEISGGTLNITALGDGLQAEEIVDISDGSVNVTTTGEVEASSNNDFRGFGNGEMKDPSQMTDEERQAMREEMQKMFSQNQADETEQDNSEDSSSKGIKAGWMLDISEGDITVNSTDHAIHCASDININGGKLTLASEVKKGISGHGDVTINDGDINIIKSTEGIETKQIMTINGGTINVVASDDGLNAGGNGGMGSFGGGQRADNMPVMTDDKMQRGGKGNMVGNGDMAPPEMNGGNIQSGRPEMSNNDGMTPPETDNNAQQNGYKQGGRGGMMGGTLSEISSTHHIQINGGTIYVNTKGDGIDSNGSIVIDGGTVTVDGPTGSGNSALDTDGALLINGGTVIAVGSAGMLETPSGSSKQNVLNYTLSEAAEAGKSIEVKTSSGKNIMSFKPDKTYQSVIFSSDELTTGDSYAIYIDGEEKDTFTVSDVISSVGTAVNSGMRGGFKGERGDREQKADKIIQ